MSWKRRWPAERQPQHRGNRTRAVAADVPRQIKAKIFEQASKKLSAMATTGLGTATALPGVGVVIKTVIKNAVDGLLTTVSNYLEPDQLADLDVPFADTYIPSGMLSCLRYLSLTAIARLRTWS